MSDDEEEVVHGRDLDELSRQSVEEGQSEVLSFSRSGTFTSLNDHVDFEQAVCNDEFLCHVQR